MKLRAYGIDGPEGIIKPYSRLIDLMASYGWGWHCKAQGDGFGYPLDGFDVSLAPGEATRLLRVGDESGELCGWRMTSFSPAPGFVGAVVTEDKGGGAHGC